MMAGAASTAVSDSEEENMLQLGGMFNWHVINAELIMQDGGKDILTLSTLATGERGATPCTILN